MTNDSSPKRKPFFQRLGSNIFLGLLVTALSVFTAATNYATFKASGLASGYETEGDRLLADSNTEYILASQSIIADYTVYDSYVVNQDVDDFAAEYFQSVFSLELDDSIARDAPFDDQYYDEMYAYPEELLDQAFEQFDLANAESAHEEAYQLAMLVSAVGLAFVAYGSLLQESNNLRGVFALMALILLGVSVLQAISA